MSREGHSFFCAGGEGDGRDFVRVGRGKVRILCVGGGDEVDFLRGTVWLGWSGKW